MNIPLPRLFFDYVDPLSYVLELRLREAEDATGVEAARHPLELAPPGGGLLDPDGAEAASRWEGARVAAARDGVDFRRPAFYPASRKAHELVLHARENGRGLEVHDAIFRAFHVEGRDVGRVDVLVELAVEAGLDRTTTKAVLDVDRHLESVRTLRRIAERLGVPGVPTLLTERRALEGIPEAETLRESLAHDAPDTPTETP